MNKDASVNIKISNCNCIKEASIEIVPKTLNIKYGYNGAGKTTISKAIFAKANSKDQELRLLSPYGNDPKNSDETPKVENITFSTIKVFDESYVNSYLFSQTSFLEDSFKVFLRSEECEVLTLEIERLLSDLQGVFQRSEKVQQLKAFLPEYFTAVNYGEGEVSKRGGVGEFIKGNGGGFEKYGELEKYRPFYEKRDVSIVSKWAKWRNDGIKQIKDKICPFCTSELEMEEIEKQNKIISKVFKNSALSSANDVLEYIEAGVELGYIKDDSVDALKSYIGESSKSDSLFAELQQLAVETDYLYTKIDKIFKFKPMNVTKAQVDNIEFILSEMIIDERQLSRFYSTTLITEMINEIREKISDLEKDTGKLKGLFNKHENRMETLIASRKDDINHFFSLAGFPYQFELKTNGENKAESYLIPIGLEEIRISKPKEHLSWGEKNAFSLVMFMFEAISDNVDLVVLDDPITSFDKDKKFAVVRRLFDNQKTSFRNMTVLMFTHDLQPVIDYVYGGFFNKFGITTPVKAKWLKNEDGIVDEFDIKSGDLVNAFELTKQIAMNKDKEMAVRVVNLRKHIELTTPNFSEAPIYEVLSNLIHGRAIALLYTKEKLDEDIFKSGCLEMSKYFGELSYDDILKQLEIEKLLELVKVSEGYDKIIVLRLLFERVEGLLLELRRAHPAACKYVNESNHVENDYIFQLDPFKYSSIPKYYIEQLEAFVNSNKSKLKNGN